MILARVTGSVVATQKLATLTGRKLLVIEPMRVDEKTQSELRSTGRTLVAVDALGAGEGELVLVVQGSSARLTPETQDVPVDAVVIGIVDQVGFEGRAIYNAGGAAVRR